MKIKYDSVYNEFTIFLTELEVGAEAIVFDNDVGTFLCKVNEIVEDDARAKGDYDGEFILDDGCYMVGVDVVRPEHVPNEFIDAIKEYFDNKECYLFFQRVTD